MPTRETAARRGYGRRWQRARLHYLRSHPLCVRCLKAGITEPASVVDHIIPHRGDRGLFWDEDNWQSLCKPCHDSDKQREEKGGASGYRGCAADGTPLDPGHHWRA